MVKSLCLKIFWGALILSSVGQSALPDWTSEIEWQKFQRSFFEKTRKDAKLGQLKSTPSSAIDTHFLNRLRQGGDDCTFLRLGLLSSLWGGTLQSEEMSALWLSDTPNMRQNVFSYLAGKFVGHQLIQYYATLEQTPTVMPAHLFDLTQQRFRALVGLKTADSSGYAQNFIASLLSSSETFKALQKRLMQEDVRRHARAFEVAYASQLIPSWIQRYIKAKTHAQRSHFEKLLLCLPSKILLLSARQFRLSQHLPEAVVSYALVASKSQKTRQECDDFIGQLIVEKKAETFEQLLPPKEMP